MSDAVDQANEVIERSLEANIRKATEQKPVSTSPWCEECGCEIPAQRREKLPWATTCVECQEHIEKRARLWRQ